MPRPPVGVTHRGVVAWCGRRYAVGMNLTDWLRTMGFPANIEVRVVRDWVVVFTGIDPIPVVLPLSGFKST